MTTPAAVVEHATDTPASQSVESKLAHAAKIIDKQLAGATNLNPLERKIVAYWTLGTHALQALRWYPLLALFGPTNTGKSSTEEIIFRFAYAPTKQSLSGMTDAVLRDFLASAKQGTAILEEADRSSKADSNSYELQLSNRCSRDTSKSLLNRAHEGGGWSKEPIDIFGATVVHRRVDFADAALATRSITISSRPNHKRRYVRVTEEGKDLIAGIRIDCLPEVRDIPSNIGNRVLQNYAPLLGVARLLGDEDFIQDILAKLDVEQAELEQAQQTEPALLILQSIIGEIYGERMYGCNAIRLATLRDRIFQESGCSLQPRQIGATARRMGLTVKISNGQSVVSPDPVPLLRACEEYGYQGEDVEDLRKTVASSRCSRPKEPNILSMKRELSTSSTSSTADSA